jgi:hypothetical protein
MELLGLSSCSPPGYKDGIGISCPGAGSIVNMLAFDLAR